MRSKTIIYSHVYLVGILSLAYSCPTFAQGQGGDDRKGPPPRRFGGPGGPGGPGGFGGPMAQERKLVKKFDKDGDGRLNKAERDEARESLKKDDGGGRMRRGPGPGFGRGNEEPVKPGPKVSPTDVKPERGPSLYDPAVLRTFFLDFEGDDWEAELEAFINTDVEVPATLTVDGKKYPNVGIHFRGASSLFMVGMGHKRSLNVSLDFVDDKQRLYGNKTLNLLNSHEDPTFLSTILYSQIARKYLPAPKANFAKVVINGESWGVYVNVEQFNKEFLEENYKTGKGARWKVKGSPGGRSGLDYAGDDVEIYKRRYQIKSGDKDKDWDALMELCKVLTETPLDKLEKTLQPILDIDEALWFLALDNALINGDGYWIRASDFSIYRDPKGRFHIIPHDMNEAFVPAMGGPGFGPGFGPGRMGGPGGPPGLSGPNGPMGPPDGDRPRRNRDDGPPDDDRPRRADDDRRPDDNGPRPMRGPDDRRAGRRPPGIDLDPLYGMEDETKPLRSRLLAVPALREKYLEHVRTIARESLDWKYLGPVVAEYRKLIEKEIEADTRKLTSFEAFQTATSDKPQEGASEGRRARPNLRSFAEKRSKYLLDYSPSKKPVEKQKKSSEPDDEDEAP